VRREESATGRGGALPPYREGGLRRHGCLWVGGPGRLSECEVASDVLVFWVVPLSFGKVVERTGLDHQLELFYLGADASKESVAGPRPLRGLLNSQDRMACTKALRVRCVVRRW
jgi:hypothetical protein